MNKTYLHSLPLIDLLPEWDRLDKQGQDPAAMRALALTDLYYLLIKILSIGKVKTKNEKLLLLHPWIYDRVREFEKSPDDHIDLWFREAGKSTIITFAGSIQEILNNPEITIGIFAQSGPIATKFLEQIKLELESNEILKKLFPDILYENPKRDAPKWSSDGLVVKRKGNPKESTIEASGLIDSMPTGRHYDLMIYDDLVSSGSVSTAEQIAKTTNAFELSLSLGKEGGKKRIIGTRYSLNDTYQVILDRKTAIPRIYSATDNGDVDGTPVMFTHEYWSSLVRDTSSTNLACQYLQNPSAGLEATFDRNDIKYYEVRPTTLNIYILVDPARSMKKYSDHTAIAVIGIDSQMNKFLLDGVCHKMELSDRWMFVRMFYNKWHQMPGVQQIYVGYEGFGSGSVDLEYIKEQMKIKEPRFEIKELYHPRSGPGSKIDRVNRLEPDIRNHKFYVPYPTDPDNLTPDQQQYKSAGLDYAISKIIKRKTTDNQIYDLTLMFLQQVEHFPKGKVDFVDAVSRIYDMEPEPPYMTINPELLEPRYV